MLTVRQPFYVTRQPIRRTTAFEAERVYRLPVDAYVTDDHLVLTASIAGLNLDNLQITMDDDELVIQGEIDGLEDDVQYVLRERFHGRFERRLRVNVPVDVKAAEATYEHGVLRLVLPKTEEAKPRQIAVNVVQ